jgi:hypothetical protein
MALYWAKAAKNMPRSALDRFALEWKNVRRMYASETQFSLTRAVAVPAGKPKTRSASVDRANHESIYENLHTLPVAQ